MKMKVKTKTQTKNKTIIKVCMIVFVSFLLSFIPAGKNTLISKGTLANIGIDLFGVSLAIMALLFTVLDRYKEKLDETKKEFLDTKAFPVIKNMGDDVIGILLIVIFLFLYDILSIPLHHFYESKYIPKLHYDRFILLLITSFMLVITIDITISIITLINNLIIVNCCKENTELNLSEHEKKLLTVIRKLDNKHYAELLEYIKTLSIKQEIEK